VSPLFLVNWQSVATRFRSLMWMLVVVLTIVVMIKVVPSTSKPTHQAPRGIPALAPANQNKP
jgi:hypothetical protein